MIDGYIYSDSESEHYDPWPGCVMCITGCHFSDHYTHMYIVSEPFAAFFHLAQHQPLSIGAMEKLVIDYAKTHKCVEGTLLLYNKDLWNLLKPTNRKQIKFYQLYRFMQKHIKD